MTREHVPQKAAWRSRVTAAALWALAAGLAGAAEPADVDGSRDHPLVPRFPGATISDFTVRERDVAAIAVSGAEVVHVEGRYTLVRYRYPPGSNCQAILNRHEAALKDAKLRTSTGSALPEEAARGVGGAAVEGWVTGVGTAPGGGSIHVLAACSEGGLAPSGPVLIVESRPAAWPLTLRGRSAQRPAFDTAPALGALPLEEPAEMVVRCPARVQVQVGPVTPVDVGEGAAEVGAPGSARWVAQFAPPAVPRQFSLAGSAIAGGQLVCRYGREGQPAEQSVMLIRPVPSGRTCVRRPTSDEFTCARS